MYWEHASMPWMDCLWRMTWQAGMLVALVVALRFILGSRLSGKWRCWLWMIVFARLVMPVMPGSSLSLFNLLPHSSPAVAPLEDIRAPVVNFSTANSPESLQSAPFVQTPQPASRTPFNWPEFILALWLTGVVVLAMRVLIVNFRFARSIARDAQSAPQDGMDLLRVCASEMKVRRLPLIVMSDAVALPALFGLFQPRLLLPPGLSQRLSRAEMRFVLMHELAHVRRRDILFSWLVCAVGIAHWFNPAVWIAMMYWRRDSEAACDQAVLAAVGAQSRVEYGNTLLNLATRLMPAAPRPAVGILNSRRELKERLKLIARFERPAMRWTLAAVALLAAVGCAGLTDARQHETPATMPAESAAAVRAALIAAAPPISQGTTLLLPSSSTPAGMVVKIYEIQDLLGFCPKIGAESDKSRYSQWPSKVDGWETLIRQNITPQVWKHGGALDDFNNQLIVMAPPQTHVALDKFLAEVRSEIGQVTVSIRLMSTSWDATRLQQEGVPILPSGDAAVAVAPGPAIVTREEVNKLKKTAFKESSTAIITVPRLTMLDGRNASAEQYTSGLYVAGWYFSNPAAGMPGDKKPNIQTVRDGFKVYVQPTVSDDGQSVLITLQVNKSQFFGFIESAPGKDGDYFQIPVQRVVQAATKVVIPRDRSAVFALMMPEVDPAKLKAATTRPANDANEQKSLVVIVTPEIIDRR